MTLPRRQFVHPVTAQLVTLSAYRGQMLSTSFDARVRAPVDMSSDASFVAAASAVPIPPGASVAHAVTVESDRHLERGLVQVSKSQPIASVLAHHEPFLSWNSVAADVNHLTDWWPGAWGAPRGRVEELCRLCTGAEVGDCLLLSFGESGEVGVELPLAVELRPASPFLSAFGAAHGLLWGRELHAGVLSVSDVRARELLGSAPSRLDAFLSEDHETWWLAGGSASELVYREGLDLELIDQSPARVVIEAILRNVSPPD